MVTKNRLNERQETFCLNIVKGMTNGQAYKNAGFNIEKLDHASAAATRLLKNAHIRQRITELKQPVYDSIDCSLRERATIYSDMARLDIDWDKAGTDARLKAKTEALHRLNQMEHVYSDAPAQDNRTFNIILMEGNKRAENELRKLIGAVESVEVAHTEV